MRLWRPGLARTLAAGAVTAAVLSAASPARAGSIAQTRAEIASLTSSLARQQRLAETTANAFDAAKVSFANITANIHRLRAKEVVKRRALGATSRQLVAAVVRAYVLGSADAQILSLFNQSVTTSDARTVYQDRAIGDLSAIKHRYLDQKRSLDSTLAEVAAQRVQAQDQERTMASLLAQNARNEQATRTTLAVVTQTLKHQIITYEVQAGAASARVGDVAGEQEAVAAASAVGGQAAANLVLAAIAAATPPKVTGTVSGSPAGSAAGHAAVAAAVSQIGVPYVWGGETPGQGFDCSGLVQWAWARAGYTIPRTTETQWPALRHVSLHALQPGDLLFYYNLDGDSLVDHVVMYVGSGPYGTNTIIAAAYPGTRINYAPLFTFGLIGAARP